MLKILGWEMILDYPSGPKVITGVLVTGRQEGQSQERLDDGWL